MPWAPSSPEAKGTALPSSIRTTAAAAVPVRIADRDEHLTAQADRDRGRVFQPLDERPGRRLGAGGSGDEKRDDNREVFHRENLLGSGDEPSSRSADCNARRAVGKQIPSTSGK